MIETTMVARCDIPACPTERTMSPTEQVQPYRALTDLGWRLETYPHQILTVCPEPHPAP